MNGGRNNIIMNQTLNFGEQNVQGVFKQFMESNGITLVVEPCPPDRCLDPAGLEAKSKLNNPSELMQLVEENTDQTEPSSLKEINYTQGND